MDSELPFPMIGIVAFGVGTVMMVSPPMVILLGFAVLLKDYDVYVMCCEKLGGSCLFS